MSSLFARRPRITGGKSVRGHAVGALGGFVAILLVVLVNRDLLDHEGAALLVGSMGATAVLLFAVPHGPLSQPWNVLAGQIVSALIGVTAAQHVSNVPVAATLAVGLSVGLMMFGSFVHPPGGATALVAVTGGASVHDLGYSFVWSPVLVNTVTILAVAVVFHRLAPGHSYPANPARHEHEGVSPARLEAALAGQDTESPMSEEALLRLFRGLQPGPTHERSQPRLVEMYELVGAALDRFAFAQVTSVT